MTIEVEHRDTRRIKFDSEEALNGYCEQFGYDIAKIIVDGKEEVPTFKWKKLSERTDHGIWVRT